MRCASLVGAHGVSMVGVSGAQGVPSTDLGGTSPERPRGAEGSMVMVRLSSTAVNDAR